MLGLDLPIPAPNVVCIVLLRKSLIPTEPAVAQSQPAKRIANTRHTMTSTGQLAVPSGDIARMPAAAKAADAPRPTLGWRSGILFATILVTVCAGAAWVYFRTSELLIAMAIAAGGVVAVLTEIGARRACHRQWTEQFAKSTAEREKWKTKVGMLQLELAQKQDIDEDWRKRVDALQGQLSALSRTNTSLQDELNGLKRAEKSLSQQQQELSRTKGVLEMHVQARTQELQKLQRRYELILNGAGEGICGLDSEGKITFVNPTAAQIMRLGVAEMIGGSHLELFADFKANGQAQPGPANSEHAIEVMAKRRDGSHFVAEYVRTSIQENDRNVGEVLLFKDITERKQAEEALSQKAAELARSNAELEQFAFVASHDLQEPLRKIQTFGDRLKAKCDAAKLEEGREYLERMQSASARMQRLINDLLTFSRVISKSEPFVSVDLGVVTREVLGDLEARIEKFGAVVEVGQLPSVEADPVQMQQLLQNLIGNALKFHAEGAKPRVRVQAQIQSPPAKQGDTALLARNPSAKTDKAATVQLCELTVQDNGIGFDEKYLGRLFAVFQRLHGRQEFEGTGIGLAVCRRIAERHGGTITARSKLGEGATFIVRLPLRQPLKTKQGP